MLCLLVTFPARSQDAHRSSPQPAATPEQAQQTQAQQTLDVLQDDHKRAQLIQTLQTIAKASQPAASTSAGPSSAPGRNPRGQPPVLVSGRFSYRSPPPS